MTVAAAYYRAWRAAHPEYRRRETARSARRKAHLGRGDRSVEYRRRARLEARRRETEAIPPLHTGHELFDAARALVGPNRSGLTVLSDPLHEDLLSVAVVALLEGDEPALAVRRYAAAERAWRRVTGPVLAEVAA